MPERRADQGPHENLPVTPEELADSVRRAARAGVAEVHLHPKDALGADTLEPAAVAAALEAVRAEAPGIPVGVTTGAWVEPDPRRRAELVGQLAGLPVLLHGTDGGMARAADGGRPRAGHPDRAGGRAAVAGRVHRYGQPGSRSGGPRVRRPLID
ncbi:3-keto-5-aminohexanoate cleavage protein [Pseudonocardia sp.]|uniref:3-keto-5-aminohexanoate cleavage protein n=1 Tax=Pseudonocardia sp. TaxID=60912 RepID=UPI003BEF1208